MIPPSIYLYYDIMIDMVLSIILMPNVAITGPRNAGSVDCLVGL